MPKRRDPQPKISEANGYDMTVTYVPSHRAGNKSIKSHYQANQQYFSIHSFNISELSVKTKKTTEGVEETYTFSSNVNTPNHTQAAAPPVPEDIKPILDLHWGGLHDDKTPEEFRKKEWNKHWKHNTFSDDKCYWRTVYELGKKYMPGGEHDLMRIITDKGYKPGNYYDCKKFVDDLLKGLQHPAWVSFRPTPNGTLYLHQISFLYHLNLERHLGVKGQTYKKGAKFLFEDFSKIQIKHKSLASRMMHSIGLKLSCTKF